MANTQAMCTSFKTEILDGIHALGTTVIRAGTGADTLKAALYLAGEVTGSGYSAGGITATNANQPANSGTTAYWTPSASFTYTNVTLTTAFDAVLIYNSTQSNKAISVHTFGSQTVTAGTFVLSMPTSDASTGLLRIA